MATERELWVARSLLCEAAAAGKPFVMCNDLQSNIAYLYNCANVLLLRAMRHCCLMDLGSRAQGLYKPQALTVLYFNKKYSEFDNMFDFKCRK